MCDKAELERVIREGNLSILKNLIKNIESTSDSIILACKHNKIKILNHVLNSSYTNKIVALLPNVKDETQHNAFYYAIRSCNIDLLAMLINKWPPNNYFANHSEELDEILSTAYDELRLKRVPLSEEMEIFVAEQLINLRLFSDITAQNVKTSFSDINKRIELLLENITTLNAEYSILSKDVDKRFLFIAQFVAKNIYILKRQLKSTYTTLPWEEIEFCLTSFISYHVKQQEINIFYQVTLDKVKILKHLENFAKELKVQQNNINIIHTNQSDIFKLAELPKLNREQVVTNIISNCPQFENLYHDYQQIRDIHSLMIINNYIDIAISADAKDNQGQLIIIRAIQIIGEHVKNTLESPKLSKTTNEVLLLFLTKSTIQIIKDLRNSFSSAYLLSNRTEIETNKDVNFFKGIQRDILKIGKIISNILHKRRMKIIIKCLKSILDCNDLKEIRNSVKVIGNTKIKIPEECNTSIVEEQIETIIKKLNEVITEQTSYEKGLFSKINDVIQFEKNKFQINIENYRKGLIMLQTLSYTMFKQEFDNNAINVSNHMVSHTLKCITPTVEFSKDEEMINLIQKLTSSVGLRLQSDKINEIYPLVSELICIVKFEEDSVKWIEFLKENLKEKIPLISAQKEEENLKQNYNYNNLLIKKITDLKSVLKNNHEVINNLLFYKKNKNLQAIVEMLVLDIMSILGTYKSLINDLLFLDDNAPLIMGKSLRNHLAHNNVVLDVLSSDPSILIILNAKKLITDDIITNKKKIGKSLNTDLTKLKIKFEQNLITLNNDEQMFHALENGNLEDLKKSIQNGADINAINMDTLTTLHVAAKGNNLEIIKFILDQNFNANVKDIHNWSPLHIAAANGKTIIVEYFLKNLGVNVDEVGSYGQTPLHVAAHYGHMDIVKVLLKYKANVNKRDHRGHSPLHYAVEYNHKDVFKILVERELNVDSNVTLGSYTSLHIAAEQGFLDFVNYLLENNANVMAKHDRGGIPLHGAALNGHLEVVNALIAKGSDVSSRVIEGCTPLHYAVEGGHEKVANVLLKHGSNVNAVDNAYFNTPLHYAAKDGHKGIVKDLLNYKADAEAVTYEGLTPLLFAIKEGHLEIVVALLNHGVNINAKNKRKSTTMHIASEYNRRDIAEILLKHGAEINAKGFGNLTPLHVAATNGYMEIIDLLIRNKAKISTQDLEGNTPLHGAAIIGMIDIIDILIKNEAEVNARNFMGITPLHAAAIKGYKDAIEFLIQNKAKVNSKCNNGITPLIAAVMGNHTHCVDTLLEYKAQIDELQVALQVAVERGFRDIIENLLANGADVNLETNNKTPLICAIHSKNSGIVKYLIEKGANVNAKVNKWNSPLQIAIMGGLRDIVGILLKNKARVIDDKYENNETLLHFAAQRGHRGIVKDLLLKGIDINAKTNYNTTALYFAAQEGHVEVLEVLLLNSASANVGNSEGAPIHIAAVSGNHNVVQILVKYGADINLKDTKNRTAVELAIAHGHLQVVKILLQHNEVNVNMRGNDNWTMLHIAAQSGHLEITSLLVHKGANVNATNFSGSKPLHIAAREGHKNVVEYYLKQGFSINDGGAANQTPLHYSAIEGQFKVAEYLIEQGADVNIKDVNGQTPIHIAAQYSSKNFNILLLKHGGIYNAVDILNKTPLECTKNKDVFNLLTSTEKLFEAVRRNEISDVENCIKAGAVVNAKNVKSFSPLHFAAWKGCDRIVNILLQNEANPNAICSRRLTPLHYAVKFSHLKVVTTLMSNGAVYNATSIDEKTPYDFASDEIIKNLFKLIIESFKGVKNNNAQVIKNLKRIKDNDTIKAIMNTRNQENQTLIVAAMQSNFKKIELLNEISQGDISAQMDKASFLAQQGDFQQALSIYQIALEKRREILGSDNPATLEIEKSVATMSFKLGAYQKALSALEYIKQKQENILGLNDKETLNTTSLMALVLHNLGRNDESFDIFQDVCEKQKQILGPNHSDVVGTQFHMALVLEKLGKYEEALNINRDVFKKRKAEFGANHPLAISAQNNIALVLGSQGKYEEALKIYREVYERKKFILGINHPDTLRTLNNIGGMQLNLNNNEATATLQEAFNKRKKELGPNHPDTLQTQYNLANAFFEHGNYISALRSFNECYDQMKAVYGPNNEAVLQISKSIKIINDGLELGGSNASGVLRALQAENLGGAEASETHRDINIAASNGDVKSVECLLRDGANPNSKDFEGRTPLHFAISYGRLNVLNMLLKNGADATLVTNKGNSPLHTAASKDNNEIVDILLRHINRNKLDEFINGKTTTSGTTPLHIAAKNGSLDVTKSLLKRGAIYNIKNKEGKTPLDLSQNENVKKLLKLIDNLYMDTVNGNVEFGNKLKSLKPDELLAATNARNTQKATLLQVATINKKRDIATQIIQGIKTISEMGKTNAENDITISISTGDFHTVERILKDGYNANYKDSLGRTLLHYAISSEHTNIVILLLKNGADVTLVTNKGNTPLHTAASKNNKEIVEILLQNVNHNKLDEYVNARTTAGGTTALHIAASNGSLEVTKCLLQRGAIYNVKNYEDKTPFNLSKDQSVINLLKLVAELFNDAQNANIDFDRKLKSVKPHDMLAVINARNDQGATLQQIKGRYLNKN